MPIYEYECPTHGRYEVSQRITENALRTCNVPDCEQPVRKLISNTAFTLKGGGWYSDGYGAKKADTSSASTAKPAAKADAAPAAAAPAPAKEAAPSAPAAAPAAKAS